MANRPQTAVSGHRQPTVGLAKTALMMPQGRKRLSLNAGADPLLPSSFRQKHRMLRALSRACAASALLRPASGSMLPPCPAPSLLVHPRPRRRRCDQLQQRCRTRRWSFEAPVCSAHTFHPPAVVPLRPREICGQRQLPVVRDTGLLRSQSPSLRNVAQPASRSVERQSRPARAPRVAAVARHIFSKVLYIVTFTYEHAWH